MTIIELFPWLIAVCITLFSVSFLQRVGISPAFAYGIGAGLGIVSWIVIVYLGKYFIVRHRSGKTIQREKRMYQVFDPEKQYLAKKDQFYECLVCGNIIPSLTKRTISCKCNNIVIDAASGQTNIRDKKKIKLFCKQ